MLQGMHLVDGAAALQQLAERWKLKTRWAFTILHAPTESAAKGLALPPLPGMSLNPAESSRMHAASSEDV